MANLTRKTSKAKTRSRRAANTKVNAKASVECPNCHQPKLPHRVCANCGHYNGKDVLQKSDD